MKLSFKSAEKEAISSLTSYGDNQKKFDLATHLQFKHALLLRSSHQEQASMMCCALIVMA